MFPGLKCKGHGRCSIKTRTAYLREYMGSHGFFFTRERSGGQTNIDRPGTRPILGTRTQNKYKAKTTRHTKPKKMSNTGKNKATLLLAC
jgi:hypothetical protein